MSAKRSAANAAKPLASRSAAKSTTRALAAGAASRGASPAAKSGAKPAAKVVTRAGRERMNLLVDPELLAIAGAALGTKNKSDAVNAALRNAAENAAILRGIDAAIGTIPDFPDVET